MTVTVAVAFIRLECFIEISDNCNDIYSSSKARLLHSYWHWAIEKSISFHHLAGIIHRRSSYSLRSFTSTQLSFATLILHTQIVVWFIYYGLLLVAFIYKIHSAIWMNAKIAFHIYWAVCDLYVFVLICELIYFIMLHKWVLHVLSNQIWSDDVSFEYECECLGAAMFIYQIFYRTHTYKRQCAVMKQQI